MKKIYGIIITIAVCALCVCSFFAVRSQRQNQNELNNLEKEAAPYQDETTTYTPSFSQESRSLAAQITPMQVLLLHSFLLLPMILIQSEN